DQGDGSGWLAEKDGIIITNGHVVGQISNTNRPSDDIEAVFDAGLPTERRFKAKVLAIDHDNDIAVIKALNATNLAEPMTIVPTEDLIKTQRLLVVGFPLGTGLPGELTEGTEKLAATLKVRESSVSGRVQRKDGSIKWIQVEGGVTHGNSGGALIDM